MALNIRLERGTLSQCPEGNYELINGVIYPKTIVTEKLSNAVRYIYGEFVHYRLANKPLDSIAPPQEELPLPEMEDTILRPEIAVTVNGDTLPSWIVEFQDSETESVTMLLKTYLYRKAGIQEFWIVDMEKERVLIYHFEKNGLIPTVLETPQRIPVGIYKGLYIRYSELFKAKK